MGEPWGQVGAEGPQGCCPPAGRGDSCITVGEGCCLLPLVDAIHRGVVQVLHGGVDAKGRQAGARAHGGTQGDEHLQQEGGGVGGMGRVCGWGGGWGCSMVQQRQGCNHSHMP